MTMEIAEQPKWSKWAKYEFMAQSELLEPYLPETELLTPTSLWPLLKKYHQVILKPLFGHKGRGIIQVSLTKHDYYEVHNNKNKEGIRGKEPTYTQIEQIIQSQPYIVQHRIPLAQINGRPLDIRIITQRKSKTEPWQTTGMIARLAGKN